MRLRLSACAKKDEFNNHDYRKHEILIGELVVIYTLKSRKILQKTVFQLFYFFVPLFQQTKFSNIRTIKIKIIFHT